MVSPKKKPLYSRSLSRPKREPRYCKNPGCGAKLSTEQTKNKAAYCDEVCRKEHCTLLRLERRPKEVKCDACEKALDPLSREPRQWKRQEMHFCDSVCLDAYRRENGTYKAMSAKCNAAVQEYKQKHGYVQGYKDRAAAVSKNNREAPPKAKHFTRKGKVWGYDVNFFPDEEDSGYRASVPELMEEIGVIRCKTVKEGLRLIRQKIIDLRKEEGQNSSKKDEEPG